jgi:serine phosphatase RsbU (regulator of sigma subunit)
MNRFVFTCRLLFILFTQPIIAQDLIVIKNDDEVIDIAHKVRVLQDRKGKLDIRDITNHELNTKFVSNKENFVNLTNDTKNTWIKFDLKNTTGKEIYLEIGEFSIPFFEVYIPKSIPNQFEVKKHGSALQFNSKEVFTNFYLTALILPQDTAVHTFYIHFIHQKDHKIPLKVSVLKNFFRKNHERDIFFGAFFGMIIIMVLYNLFIYFTIRETVYLYYILHIVMSGLASIAFAGYGFDLFWSNYPYLNRYIDVFNVTVPGIASVLFTIAFLETRKYTPFWHKGLLLFMAVFTLNIGIIFYTPRIGLLLGQISFLIAGIYICTVSIIIYIKGNKVAKFYIVANSIFVLSIILLLLKINRIIPNNFFTAHANIFGISLEILFFSFALADKINIYKKDKEEAQEKNLEIIKEQKEILEMKVKERTQELENASAEILAQNEELHQQQEETLAVNEALEATLNELKYTSNRLNKSIKYANQIQQVILPQKDELDSFFADHFITYLPKDMVSGDFYWFTLLDNHKAIFVLADCTGHGVPGAFMSMIGNTLLHETIKTKEIINPAEILNYLHTGVRNVLKQEESKNSDGMDVSICLFEKDVSQKQYKVTFAGAKSSLFYTQNNQICQLVGDRITIGGFTERKREFNNYTFDLKEGELIYFTSDGYIDQHNVERKRFGSNKFKQLLSFISQLSILEQERVILSALKGYQQNEEQRDDISVIGIKM